VSFSDADGMFLAGSSLYYATKGDGNLHKVAFDGTVSGSSTVVSGPGVDGTNWRNRAMFLYAGARLNQSPTASFSTSCDHLVCTFDSGASSDPDGSVSSYSWEFGDGTNSSVANPAHTYASAGDYVVKLTVKDDKGASSSVTHTSSVTAPPPNQAPTAAFTSTCAGGTCTFDASGSSDPDGAVASYAWDFGDGTTGTGGSTSHTYATSGSFAVVLTVKDGGDATGTVQHQIAVTVPASKVSFVGSAHSDGGSTKSKTAKVPATVQAGDTLVVFVTQPSTMPYGAPAGVTGWSKVDSVTNSTMTSTLWTKVAAAGDAGSNVTMSSSTYSKALLTVTAYRNVDINQVTAARSVDSATANHVSPTVQAKAGDWVMSYWVDKSSSASGWTAPQGVTTRDTATDTGAGRFGFLTADSDGPVTEGSYGQLTATTDNTSEKGVAWTVKFTPSP
jgi:PKD repeat protein